MRALLRIPTLLLRHQSDNIRISMPTKSSSESLSLKVLRIIVTFWRRQIKLLTSLWMVPSTRANLIWLSMSQTCNRDRSTSLCLILFNVRLRWQIHRSLLRWKSLFKTELNSPQAVKVLGTQKTAATDHVGYTLLSNANSRNKCVPTSWVWLWMKR